MTNTTVRLDAQQIENILDRLIPAIADPKDHEFFRGILSLCAENYSSTTFAVLVQKLLA